VAGSGDQQSQAPTRDLLYAAGFTGITTTSTYLAGTGLHSAIIQATRPAATTGKHPAQP
jgi:hypothetical protein